MKNSRNYKIFCDESNHLYNDKSNLMDIGGILKHGNIYISDYQSIKELKKGVKNYIHKYNFKRFHSSIGYKKPMNYYLEFIKSVG